jgi:hypothetical protein
VRLRVATGAPRPACNKATNHEDRLASERCPAERPRRVPGRAGPPRQQPSAGGPASTSGPGLSARAAGDAQRRQARHRLRGDESGLCTVAASVPCVCRHRPSRVCRAGPGGFAGGYARPVGRGGAVRRGRAGGGRAGGRDAAPDAVVRRGLDQRQVHARAGRPLLPPPPPPPQPQCLTRWLHMVGEILD